MHPTAPLAPGTAADTLVEDRAAFNSYVYTHWQDAVDALEARKGDPRLDDYLAALLPQGIPAIMEGKQSLVLFRHIATPNYEICRFMIAANAIDHLQPLILEYTKDRFNNRNDWKFSLAKLRFHKGLNKVGEAIFESKNIIDVNAGNNKELSSIDTHWGQNLVDFHHELFNESFPAFTENVYDLSDWLHGIGPSAKDYYKAFLSLFLKDAILFENFLLDSKEYSFTKEIIVPAILELEAETGYRPLIVALEPTEIEGDAFWLSHPISRKGVIDRKLDGQA